MYKKKPKETIIKKILDRKTKWFLSKKKPLNLPSKKPFGQPCTLQLFCTTTSAPFIAVDLGGLNQIRMF
jgi:hypothetical protein